MSESELPRVSVALLLVALFASVAIGWLWLTEPSLPLRTHIAFAAIVAIGLSWAAYAVWVLTPTSCACCAPRADAMVREEVGRFLRDQ